MVIHSLSMASTELPKLCGSINALKGHLTHTLDWVDKFLLYPVNKMMQDSTLSFQNEITKRHSLLEEAVMAASSISEEEYGVQWQGMVAYEDWVALTHTLIAKLLMSLNQVASESLLNASMATTATSLPAGVGQFIYFTPTQHYLEILLNWHLSHPQSNCQLDMFSSLHPIIIFINWSPQSIYKGER